MNLLISYRYRDASNYKQSNTVILKGALATAQLAKLEQKLSAGDGFIPSDIDLPDLQTQFGGVNGDDHVFHELVEIDTCNEAPTIKMTAEDLDRKVMAIVDWDIEAAMERLGLYEPVPMLADGGPDMSEYQAYVENNFAKAS